MQAAYIGMPPARYDGALTNEHKARWAAFCAEYVPGVWPDVVEVQTRGSALPRSIDVYPLAYVAR